MVSADIKNLELKFKNFRQGITLIEILVVVFIIGLLLTVLVLNFPKIQRQFALSRATHKFAQDLRRAQDLALSGAKIKDANIKGYGVFVDFRDGFAKDYIIYADVASNSEGEGDKEYHVPQSGAEIYCRSMAADSQTDCIVDKIDLNNDARGVRISGLYNINKGWVSINFNPPNPTVSISGLSDREYKKAGVELSLDLEPKNKRFVYIWTSGLIETQ